MQAKLLFVEDEASFIEVYKKHFSTIYNTEFASEGKEGVRLAIESVPDVIVLDVMLPGAMNGYDVLRELKMNQKTKEIPVIVFTNLGGEEKTAIEMGAAGFYVKANTSMEELEKIVLNVLEKGEK